MGIAQKHVSEAVTATLVHAEKPREIANPFSHMKNRYFITFAFALLATSVFCTACRQTKQAEGLIPIPDKTAYSSSISALLDEYRFIPLSTTDENLLGRIAKIIKYNNKFYIASDRKRILVFNADGSFSHQIDRLGRGPQEYTELADFDISNDRIFLLGFRKVFVYSLEGMFIKRIDLPYNTLKLQTIGNDLLIRSNKESLFYRIDIASGESKDLRIGMKQSTRIDEDNCFKPYPDGYLMQEGTPTSGEKTKERPSTISHPISPSKNSTYFPTTVFSTNKRRTNIFANTVPATTSIRPKSISAVVPVGKINISIRFNETRLMKR